ncbi:WW domain binding protein [Hirsutella rhossiliensis]|uniref:WW domain binding protein n=1 Tax=Hirsutella rhossiliensis TaxID=111463 RepID=A0A9P8MZU8_9HYPO|nr:WW domain binding protein [Hirsutella rhossiliensis]KAH0964269.1 WW domain binding protein [Hirsutella rhossiliensis]
MPKERNFNPVQAQRKADKARAIKKGKAEVQEKRNERLARKNPDRIQKQIDDLKAIASKGGKLTSHEEQVLAGLEKELKAVKRAREAVGDNAPSFSRARDGDSRPGVLGKRRRGSQDASSSDEDVPDDVRSIPMPRDTPPPISKDVMDQWYAKRRARRNTGPADRHDRRGDDGRGDTSRVVDGERPAKKETPATEYKTVYEAKPIMRDLRKEAVSAFVPAAVQMKMAKGQGQGGLLEPEEADRLEREGYLKTTAAGEQKQSREGARTAAVEDAQEDEEEG